MALRDLRKSGFGNYDYLQEGQGRVVAVAATQPLNTPQPLAAQNLRMELLHIFREQAAKATTAWTTSSKCPVWNIPVYSNLTQGEKDIIPIYKY